MVKTGGNGNIPWWITYINKNGEIIQGCNREHLEKNQEKITYAIDDIGEKQQQLIEFQLFLDNPNKFIAEKKAELRSVIMFGF